MDEATRQRAVIQRSLGIATLPDVGSRSDLEARIKDLAASLRVATVFLDDLHIHAEQSGDERRLNRLIALAAAGG